MPNRVTLAPGHNPEKTYLYVNKKRVSVAALLALDLPAATTVYAIGCTGLTALDLPAATTVYVSGCTGLTALDLPAATTVYVSGCTGLTAAVFAGRDSRGYDFVGLKLRGEWRVLAGCRNFSFRKARLHWARNAECLALVEKIAADAERRDDAARTREAA
jgi:hypothetical protein